MDKEALGEPIFVEISAGLKGTSKVN